MTPSSTGDETPLRGALRISDAHQAASALADIAVWTFVEFGGLTLGTRAHTPVPAAMAALPRSRSIYA